MNQPWMFRIQIERVQWQLHNHAEILAGSREEVLGGFDTEGAWQQTTTLNTNRRPRSHAHFLNAVRLWRRASHRLGIVDMECGCIRRNIRVAGNGISRATPEWSVHLAVPNPKIGILLISRAYHRALPPFRELIHEINDLRWMKPGPASPLEEPVLIHGGRLLDYLTTSLGHLSTKKHDHGEWKTERSRSFIMKHGINNTETFLPDPMLPGYLGEYIVRFHPEQTCSRPGTEWHACHYDAERNVLVCRKRAGMGGETIWRTVALERPLYRYFHKLAFLSEWRMSVVKGTRYAVPDALLFPS
jgi:hypothetical protein